MADLKKVIYSPLDVPGFEFDREKLLAWHDKRKVRVSEPYMREISLPWEATYPRSPRFGARTTNIVGSAWNPSFVEEFPEIVEVVDNHLPFSKITLISMLSQLVEVPRHQDLSKTADPTIEPATYRCTLINDEPERTFYLRRGVRSAGTLQNEDLFPKYPAETRWWVMSNHTAMHGSYLPSPGKKKLILNVWGEVDVKKHLSLVQRSCERFKDYVIEL